MRVVVERCHELVYASGYLLHLNLHCQIETTDTVDHAIFSRLDLPLLMVAQRLLNLASKPLF